MRKSLCAASFAVALLLGGCTTTEVRSADLVQGAQHLCIKQNPALKQPGLLPALQQAIAANGLSSEVFDGMRPQYCRYVVSYEAKSAWTSLAHVTDLTMNIERDGEVVAVGQYHARGGTGLELNKPGSIKAKMDPVVDQLLAIYKRNGTPPKATTLGLAPTTFEPVAESRTQVDTLPGKNAANFVPVKRKPSLQGTVPATVAPADATATQAPPMQTQVAPRQQQPASPPATQPVLPASVRTTASNAPAAKPIVSAPMQAPASQLAASALAPSYGAPVDNAMTNAAAPAKPAPQAVAAPAPANAADKLFTYTNSPEGAARALAATRNCMVRFSQLQQYNGKTVYSSVCWGDKRLLISCEAGMCSELH